jgi:RNA polymerase sigma-70 factor (ECF subfamily)
MVNPVLDQDMNISGQSIDEIYLRHVYMLYRVCYAYLRSHADAEDIVSDVFVKLIRRGTYFQSVEHEKAWLLRVAINLCKDSLKHWWRNREDIDDYCDLESGSMFHEDETLNKVLMLPERYKAAIYLHYYEGYTTEETAKILRKPHSTIRYHLHMGRKLLKEILENEE